MQEAAATKQEIAGLLSAASANAGENGEIPALFDIGGEPLISHQIRVLRQFGIDRFFIEVDQVPGLLLTVCDRARQNGATIEFVRSPQELAQKLPQNFALFTLAEGVVADPKLIAEMTADPAQFVATVDGREENSGFERMDLNTRWAGIARFSRNTVSSVANLPEGWSIASSLLRQAMQQGVAHKPLKQVQLQDQKLCLVVAPEEADAMTSRLLTVRADRVGGALETWLFGPAAKWLTPKIWHHEIAKKAIPYVSCAAALSSIALAWFRHEAFAALSALVAIFGLSLLTTMTSRMEGQALQRIVQLVIWISLAAALMVALWTGPGTAIFDLLPGAVLIGLLLYARQSALPRWARMFLASPALAALILLFFAIFDGVALGATLISYGYLAVLIIAQTKTAAERVES